MQKQGRGRPRIHNIVKVVVPDAEDDSQGTIDLPHRGRPPKNLKRQKTLESPKNLGAKRLHTDTVATLNIKTSVNIKNSASKRLRRMDLFGGGDDRSALKLQSESFVMKLFDRSVDLSKYTERTSLYPICRAWMLNQPRNSQIPSFTGMELLPPKKAAIDATELLAQLRSKEIKEVLEMPYAQPKKIDKILTEKEAEVGLLDDLVAMMGANDTDETKVEKQDLMNDHLKNWKKVKRNWLNHTKQYQKRYEINYNIIQQMFTP